MAKKKSKQLMGEMPTTQHNKKGVTSYQSVLDGMAKCKKHGDKVFVPTPADQTPQQQQNRLNTVMRRYAPKAPSGMKWIKRHDEVENGVNIILVKDEEIKTKGKKQKSSSSRRKKTTAHRRKPKASRTRKGTPRSKPKAAKRKATRASRKKVSKPTKKDGKPRPAKAVNPSVDEQSAKGF